MKKRSNRKEFKGTSRETLEKKINSRRIKPMVIGCGAEGSFLLDLYRHISNIPSERALIASRTNQIREPEISYLLSEKSLKALRKSPKELVDEGLDKTDIDTIIDIVDDKRIVLLLGSLWDGEGTYLLPLVADTLKGSGKMLLAFVTHSNITEMEQEKNFFKEGISFCGKKGLKVMSVYVNSLDKLKTGLPVVPVYRFAVKRLASFIEFLDKVEYHIDLVNLGIENAEAVFNTSDRFFFNTRIGRLSDEPSDLLEMMLKDTMVDLDIDKVNGALFDIKGGEEFTIKDTKYYRQVLCDRFPNIKMIWGASLEKSWSDQVELSLILSFGSLKRVVVPDLILGRGMKKR